jgi:phosphoserine phosphatase
MPMKRWLLAGILFLVAGPVFSDPLESWNEGPAKQSILNFINQATQENSASYIPVDQRIVVFDNDGTLWAEMPMYVQFMFAMDRVKAMAPQHPEWKVTVPFNYLLNGDIKSFLDTDMEKNLTAILADLSNGLTTEEYETMVKNWLRTARHPQTGRPYTSMVYQPMLELMTYMRTRGFKTFIVALGGVEFLRSFAEEAYGVPREQVIGSSTKVRFEMRNGEPVLVKTNEIQTISHKEGKVLGIWLRTGRQPIAAFGNSDGDQQMLEWASIKPRQAWSRGDKSPRLAVLIHHDDAKREWAYDRKSKVGMLDKALDEAKERSWVVVSMKDDWKTIYPPVPSGQ